MAKCTKLTATEPPSEREVARVSETVGACATFGLNELHCCALSLSQLRCQLPPGGSLLFVQFATPTFFNEIYWWIEASQSAEAHAPELSVIGGLIFVGSYGIIKIGVEFKTIKTIQASATSETVKVFFVFLINELSIVVLF